METDRHASDGEDRFDGTASASTEESTEADGPRGHESASPAHEAATGASDGAAAPHRYGYGEDPLEAAGTDGPRAADSGTSDSTDPGTDPGEPAGATASARPGSASHPAPGADPSTGLHSATDLPGSTALRGGTAPRAVLRPVPEGFPTPPPRPARPNRRPAPQPAPSGGSGRPRGLLIAGIAIVAVLLLAVVVGGGFLVVRSLDPAGTADAPAPSAADDPGTQSAPDQAGTGSTEVGGVVFTEVSTELGVRSVGSSGAPMEPEGEFIIVTYTVENPTSESVQMGGNVSLETADGTYPVDRAATDEHTTDTRPFDVVAPDTSQTFHAVFDVPIGAEPTGLHIDLEEISSSGTLPLGG